MSQYAEAQAIINKMAEVKMTMNAHKGNIEDVPPHDLMDLMEGELGEIRLAFKKGEASMDGVSMINVIEEAADVQNFLLALVQQQLNAYRSRK